MHRAADKLPMSLFPKIKSVVRFGDPNLRLGRLGDEFPAPLRAKVLQVCAKGDPVSISCPPAARSHPCSDPKKTDKPMKVCDSGSCQFYHLTYIRSDYIEGATEFIVRAFRGNHL